MNQVVFNKVNGSLGRPPIGEDHISALIIKGATSVGVQKVTSLEEFETLTGQTYTNNPIAHYHVSEFFRAAPGSTLYFMQTTYDIDDVVIKQLVNSTGGEIRQIGIVLPATEITTAYIELVNAALEDLYNQNNTPVIALASFHNPAANLATLPNLHTLNCPRVSVVIGGDGAGRGKYEQNSLSTKTLGCMGYVLGLVSSVSVSQSIFWVGKRNMVSTLPYRGDVVGMNAVAKEFDVITISDDDFYSDITPAQLDALNNKGYIFPRKFVMKSGSYLNDSFTAAPLTSDYCYMEVNRTSDKADRIMYETLVDYIGANVSTDPNTGNILEESAASIEAYCTQAINAEMSNDISAVQIFIPRNQQPVINSQLVVKRKIVIKGVLREIIIDSSINLSV